MLGPRCTHCERFYETSDHNPDCPNYFGPPMKFCQGCLDWHPEEECETVGEEMLCVKCRKEENHEKLP